MAEVASVVARLLPSEAKEGGCAVYVFSGVGDSLCVDIDCEKRVLKFFVLIIM